MNVLLVSASYVPVLGGLQAVTHNLARQLMLRGHEVRVVTNRYPRSLPAEEVIDLVPVQRWLFLNLSRQMLWDKRPELFLASLYHAPRNIIRLAQVLASYRPDTVNLHFPDSQTGAILWLRHFFSFRLVVSLHGHDVERWNEEGARACARSSLERFQRLLRAADAVTACSRYLLARAAEIEPSVANTGLAIHNGIDLQQFFQTDKYAHPRPYLLAYGRLTYKKGFDLLLRAFSETAKRWANMDLIVAGEGEEAATLSRLSNDLGLRERVFFFGRANTVEVRRLVRGSRAVVIPSRQEPFGLVAIEALACGRPLVAARVGGLPEIAEALPGASLILAEPEPIDLARAIAQALCLEPGHPPALERFSWQQMASEYERVLQP